MASSKCQDERSFRDKGIGIGCSCDCLNDINLTLKVEIILRDCSSQLDYEGVCLKRQDYSDYIVILKA